MGITADVPHTIVELEAEDAPKYCHSCDLQTAKAYAQAVEAANTPRIVLPGEYN
jgi:hypothetical protein